MAAQGRDGGCRFGFQTRGHRQQLVPVQHWVGHRIVLRAAVGVHAL
ncbi:hypothetical protein OG216_00130 [Streptomycetaceae bacterium NBC_01309]